MKIAPRDFCPSLTILKIIPLLLWGKFPTHLAFVVGAGEKVTALFAAKVFSQRGENAHISFPSKHHLPSKSTRHKKPAPS